MAFGTVVMAQQKFSEIFDQYKKLLTGINV
jgi:hypothetical protein